MIGGQRITQTDWVKYEHRIYKFPISNGEREGIDPKWIGTLL